MTGSEEREMAPDDGSERENFSVEASNSQMTVLKFKTGKSQHVNFTNEEGDAIVDFIKNEELHNNDHKQFKDHHLKSWLWQMIATRRGLKVTYVRKGFDTQRTYYGKLEVKKTKSCSVPFGLSRRESRLQHHFSCIK